EPLRSEPPGRSHTRKEGRRGQGILRALPGGHLLRNSVKLGAGLIVIALIGGAGWRYFRPRPLASAAAEQPVTVEMASMEEVLVVAGQVKPAVTIDLRAEASGI